MSDRKTTHTHDYLREEGLHVVVVRKWTEENIRRLGDAIDHLGSEVAATSNRGAVSTDEVVGQLLECTALLKAVYDLAKYQPATEGADENELSDIRVPTPEKTGEGRSVLEEIAAERQRQTEVEGWTPEHDDTHSDRSLASAATCYAWAASVSYTVRDSFRNEPPPVWPSSWGWDWWKPKDRRRDLVRAGALIVAEIERLDRQAASGTEEGLT